VQAVIMAAQLADERPQPAQPARQPMVNTPPGGLGTAVQNAQSRTAPGQSTSSSQTNPPNAPSPSSPQAAALAPLPRSYPLVVPSHAMGLKIDSDGHVLLPFFLDAKQLPTDELRAWTLDGKGGRAKFVGADAATRVTLLKLADDTNIGQPCRPSDLGRPLDAEVVLLLPDSVSGGQLILWTGGARDDGLVFNPDGTVRGFASDGRFVALTTADPVVRQLAATGKVKRPKIGVLLSEFAVGTASRPDDAPANRTALLVTEVIPGGPAEKAGVRKGDFVMTFNGIDIPDLPTFATAIAGADRPTKLKVLRDRRLVEVTLPLAP
jgi:CBS domain-containing protein